MKARGFIVLLAALAVAGAAEEFCSKNIVCVETQPTEKGVTFTVKNLETYDVTVTLRTTVTNMDADVELPVTRTYAPKTATKVATLTVANPEKDWRWNFEFDWTFEIGRAHV